MKQALLYYLIFSLTCPQPPFANRLQSILFQTLELLFPTFLITIVSCLLIKAEKPLTLFNLFKMTFVTIFSTTRAVIQLSYPHLPD